MSMMRRTEILQDTVEKLTGVNKFNIKYFRRIIRPVAEAYHAASFSLSISGSRNQKTVYLYGKSDAETSGQSVVYTNKTGDNRSAAVRWECAKGYSWTGEEQRELMHMSHLAYIISGRIRLGELANQFYFHDTVTGLHNINYLNIFADNLASAGVLDHYAAMFINLIGFNYINKKVGNQNGTSILTEYAKRIQSFLGKDELAARLGGDNFVIFCKKENLDNILDKLSGIRINQELDGETLDFLIQARAGVFNIDNPHMPFGLIMNYISATVNYAKNIAHNNIIFYTPQIEEQLVAYKEYAQRFKDSLEKDEFFVMYQPKVCSTDNTIYGGEALVRWYCDSKVISPGAFIKILEREHLICKLDFYVLEQTCKAIRRWLDLGLEPVKISINFSNEHLFEDNLVENIVRIVDSYKIDHSLIEIEMTETVDNEETNKLLSYVDGLHKQGFTVAIDDFGIGYSSLHLLQSVSVDVLKVDKSFVDKISMYSNVRENIILKHIINLAYELGIEVVAEGVETVMQKEQLKNLNCHKIQGYIYDKPLPESEFIQRIIDKNYGRIASKV